MQAQRAGKLIMDAIGRTRRSSSPPMRPRSSSWSALIAWVVLDYRAQRRMLADLEARGVTRRSERAKEPA